MDYSELKGGLSDFAVRIAPVGSQSGDTRWESAQAMRAAIGAITALEARVAELTGALKPFARAEAMSAGFNGEQCYAVLHYPADAEETICLAALDAARTALENTNGQG